MDILQLMKENHESLRCALHQVEEFFVDKPSKSLKISAIQENLAPLAKRVHVSLSVESEFLCPELEDRFPGVSVVLDIMEANRRVIKRLAGEIWPTADLFDRQLTSLPAKVQGLADHLKKHVEAIEQLLMPKIRMHISTPEREDLGQVFSDVMEERLAETPTFSKVKSTSQGDKAKSKVIPLAKKRRA